MLTALVVDDDPACRTAVQVVLEAAGWRVLTATGPDQARGMHDLYAPDLLVTDVWMVEGDGLTLLAQLRADGRTTPAVVVTSDPRAEVRDRAAALDARGVLAKPVDTAALLELAGTPRPGVPDGWDDDLWLLLDYLYRDALPGRLAGLSAAAAAADTGALARLAHALAGASAQLGRSSTALACRALERAARAGRVDLTALVQLTSR